MASSVGRLQSPGSSSVSRPTKAVKMRAESSNGEEPMTLAGDLVPPRPEPAEPVSGVRPQNCTMARRRWPPRYPGCAEALNMLMLRPVFATPVPRHHVESRAADGSRLVHDRATSERFVVYSPRFGYQFSAGHRAGLWYLAPVGMSRPCRGAWASRRHAPPSRPRAGNWRLSRSRPNRDRPGEPCIVIWS